MGDQIGEAARYLARSGELRELLSRQIEPDIGGLPVEIVWVHRETPGLRVSQRRLKRPPAAGIKPRRGS